MTLISKARTSHRLHNFLYYFTLAFTLIYVFSVPSFGESTSITKYIIYFSMVFLGLSSIIFCYLYSSLRINKICLIIPLFAVFALIGTLIGSKDYRSWLSLILLAGSFYVFVYAFKAINNKNLVVSVVSAGIFIFSVYFIFHYRSEIFNFKSYGSESFRLGFYFDNPNGVSAYAAVGFATSLYLILFLKRKIRFLFVLPLLSSGLVGVSTGSRTFIFAIAIFVIVLLYFKFIRHKFIYLIVVASVILLGVILINLPFMNTLRQRIIDAFETLLGISSKADTSTISRTIWIDYGFYLGARNLIFGLGVNGFSIFSGVGTYSHSNFAEVICDFGLVGFILFYLPIVFIVLRTIFNKRVDKPLVFSFAIYYLLVGFSNVFYYKKFYYLILAFMFYLTYVENVLSKETKIINNLQNVVFTCDSMRSGGAEKVIASLANYMTDKGIDVTIIGVSDLDVPYSFYELKKAKYINLSNGSGKRINSIKRILLLRKTIKTINPDVVISFLPHVNVYTSLSLFKTEIPHIVSERNNPYVNPKGKIMRLLKKMSFEFSSGCVFQTSGARDFYSSRVKERSAIIHNPIDLKFIPQSAVEQKSKIVLAVGRLEKQKNYYCLLDAFKKFNDIKNHAYLLKIYGEGSLKESLLEYCHKLNITDYVVFMGSDNNWHEKEYKDALYVLSSDYEGMPNSLSEAMALGIPSVSTDCPSGGPKELIVDGENGFLVPINDSDALTAKMLEAIESSSAILFDNTRHMLSDYSVDEIASQWINYLEGLTKIVYE